MLCRRHLIQFGPANEMFESDVPEVRQFLAGDTKGPIGMAEEKDEDIEAESTSGKSYEETEEMERASGGSDGYTPPPPLTDEEWREAKQAREESDVADAQETPQSPQPAQAAAGGASEAGMFEGWNEEPDGKDKK
jgi:hypothetical protein